MSPTPTTSTALMRRRLLLAGTAALTTGATGVAAYRWLGRGGKVARFGVAQPLTGPLALFGGDMLNGALMASEQINAAGGLQIGGRNVQVEILGLDDKADASTGRLVAQQLVDAEVLAAIAHLNSGVSIAAAPIYAQAGIPQLAISTKTEYTRLGLPTTLRLVANDDMQAQAMAQFVTGNLQARTVAALDDGSAYGKGLMQSAVSSVYKAGTAAVVHQFSVDDKTTDFARVVRSLLSAKVDVLMTSVSDFQAEALLLQLSAAGLKDLPLVGGDTCKTPLLEKAAVEARPIFATTPIVSAGEFLGGKAFLTEFRRRFGSAPHYAAHYAFDAVYLLGSALRRNGNLKRSALLEQLKTFDGYAPVTSYLRFGPDGEQRTSAVGIYRLRKGQWELQVRSGRW